MIRLLIYVGLIALFACTSKPGTQAPTTISSLPDSTINSSLAADCTGVDSQAVIKIVESKRASYPKTQTEIAKNIPQSVTIKSILQEFDSKPLQEHNITGSNDTTIYFGEGTIIKIPSNAFVSKKTGQEPKGKIRMVVKEFYSLSDILFANLTTTTKTEILETGGMIYINAYAGTDTLVLEKNVEIHFPFKDKIEGMQLFTGQRDTSNIMVWKTLTEEEFESDMEENISVYTIAEEMPTFPGGYEGFIRFLRNNLKYPADARRKGVEGTVYVNVVIDANGKVGEKKILKSVNESLDQAALDAFNNMPTWKPGRAAGKNVSIKMAFPVYFRLGEISFASSQPTTAYNEDLRKNFEKNLSDSVLQKSSASVVSHYILSSSKLGWINCDRFIDKKPRTKFRVLVGDEKNSDVKMIFRNYKSVLPGYYVDGYYQFDNVPVGEPITIIAIRAQNDGLMLAISKTTINKSIYSALDFKPVTVEMLKDEMRKIK
jgi:TonB family protein